MAEAEAYWDWNEEDLIVDQPVTKLMADLGHEFGKHNPNHVSSGPHGGEFAAGSGNKVAGGLFQANSGKGLMYQMLENGEPKYKQSMFKAVIAHKNAQGEAYGLPTTNTQYHGLKKAGKDTGAWEITEDKFGMVTMKINPEKLGTKLPKPPKPIAPATTTTGSVAPALHTAEPMATVSPKSSHLDGATHPGEALANLGSASDKFMGKLNQKETKAVMDYTGSAYREINTKLRAGAADPLHSDKVVQLTQAIRKGNFDVDTIVYRGMPSVVGKALSPGSVFIDHGFISTSIMRNRAMGFSPGTAKNVARIKVAAGHEVGPVGKHSSHSTEQEVILQRGSMFRVDSVTKVMEGSQEIYVHEMTLL